MSLVIDALKKVKSNSGKGSVPPSMMNLAPKNSGKKGPNKGLILLFVLVCVGAGIIFYLDSNQTREYKVTKPAVKNKNSNAKKTVQQEPVKASQVKKKNIAQASNQETRQSAQVSEQEIQQRIDDAVDRALAKVKQDNSLRVQNPTDVNRQRVAALDKLPMSADKKESDVRPVKEASEEKPVESEVEESVRNSLEKKTAQRPVLSDSQRRAYEKKIQYNNTLTMASTAFRKGDFRKASELYERAFIENKTSNNLSKLISSEVRAGDFDAAQRNISKYADVADPMLVSAAALDMSSMGFHDEGLELLENNIGKFEDDSRIFYTAGLIQEGRSEYARAENAYRKAIDIKPADAYYTYALARLLDIQEKYKEAVIYYEKASILPADKTLKRNASARAVNLRDYLKSLEESESKTASTSSIKQSE
jgi:tetratricopeptide (TPR) repeat protein